MAPNGFDPDRTERPGKIRAFFALPLPDDVKRALLDSASRMMQKAERSRLGPRWQTGEKLHLTLKFLGWVPPEAVTPLWQMAAEAVADLAPIAATLEGLSAFPKLRYARVLIARLSDPERRLAELATRLEKGAEVLGIPSEDREFRAHVTLARIKQPGNVKDWIDAADFTPREVRFDELCLYESKLTPEMSFYRVLERARFHNG